ncbi:MAG TPA: hypothetical protein VJN71_01835 [Nitrososphaerales archaeon]|nr:hypothetical protein [Nitrososphaerales archaeon]
MPWQKLPRRWKGIYDFVILNDGHVSESTFNDSLSYLKYGMVGKNREDDMYEILDPMISEYVKKL